MKWDKTIDNPTVGDLKEFLECLNPNIQVSVHSCRHVSIRSQGEGWIHIVGTDSEPKPKKG